MIVGDAMKSDLVTIEAGASVAHAARRMKEMCTGLLLVIDENKISGVVTERDLVIRSLSKGFDPKVIRVRKVMTEDLIWCLCDHSPSHAAELMVNHNIRRLIVVDRNYKCVGVISIDDLAKLDVGYTQTERILTENAKESTEYSHIG
jgi:CBS domain-containing protein